LGRLIFAKKRGFPKGVKGGRRGFIGIIRLRRGFGEEGFGFKRGWLGFKKGLGIGEISLGNFPFLKGIFWEKLFFS